MKHGEVTYVKTFVKVISAFFSDRLACCGDAEMRRFMIEAESALFQCRVSCMNAQELTALVRPLRKYSGAKNHSIINKDCVRSRVSFDVVLNIAVAHKTGSFELFYIGNVIEHT